MRQKHCAIRPHVPAGLGFRQGQPIERVCHPFCHGELGDVGRSRMPIDRSFRKSSPKTPLRSRIRWRDNEEIHRRDAAGVIIEKCFATLDDGSLCKAIYLVTLVCPISMPSLRSSPWIRGAPNASQILTNTDRDQRMSFGRRR